MRSLPSLSSLKIYIMNNLLLVAFALLRLFNPLNKRIEVNVQSIIGRWHVLDFKETITDKKTGITSDADSLEPGMLEDLRKMVDYNCDLGADHLIIMDCGFKGGKLVERRGVYTLEGESLRFKGTLPGAFKAPQSGSPLIIPDFVAVSFRDGNMTWHYFIETEEEGHIVRSDVYLIWQRR